MGRVGKWRGGSRPGMSVAAPFVWRCLSGSTIAPFSTSLSSNRTCGFPSIRLSDKTSRLRPRHVVSKPGQTHEPEGLVEVREWIAAALASSGLVLEAQPPTQPHSRIVVERPIRRIDGAYREVVRPSAQRAVHLSYQLCGFLPRMCSDGQLMDLSTARLMLFF